MSNISAHGQGVFYPEDFDELNHQIHSFIHTRNFLDFTLQNSNQQDTEEIFTVCVPHAAYEFTGPLIGKVFSLCAQFAPEQILILAPLHAEPIPHTEEAFLYTTLAQSISGPWGVTPIDFTLIEQIRQKYPEIYISDTYFSEEVSIELLLPFVANTFPHTPVIPLYSYARQATQCKKTVPILKEVISGKRTLIILSSNFSDYLPWDKGAIHAEELQLMLTKEKTDTFLEAFHKKTISACGFALFDIIKRLFPDGLWKILIPDLEQTKLTEVAKESSDTSISNQESFKQEMKTWFAIGYLE